MTECQDVAVVAGIPIGLSVRLPDSAHSLAVSTWSKVIDLKSMLLTYCPMIDLSRNVTSVDCFFLHRICQHGTS